MEPLSLGASIVTVVAAANSLRKGLRKAQQSWRAPRHIEELVADTQSLRTTLDDVQTLIKGSKALFLDDRLEKLIKLASSIIDEISSLVKVDGSQKNSWEGRYRDRWTWFRHAKQLNQHVERLAAIETGITFRLITIITSSTIETSKALSRLEVPLVRPSSPLGVQRRDMDKMHAKSIQTVDPAEQHMLCGSTHSESLRNDCVITGIRLTRTSFFENEKIDEASGNLNTHEPDKCEVWCSCKCHTECSFGFPWVLENLIGRMNLRYSGQRPACDEIKCKRTSGAHLTLTYHPPKRLLYRYLTMKMRYNVSDGPMYALRSPRITTWENLYWNYATSGDMMAIQAMFSQGVASPFDLNLFSCNALMYPSVLKDHRMVKFLLEQGADPDEQCITGRTPKDLLLLAVFSDNFGNESYSVACSVSKATDCNRGLGFSRLHKIVLGLITSDLKAELDISTTDINVGDSWNLTPLHHAVNRNDVAAIKTLFGFNANPNLADRIGNYPLHYVKKPEVCELLLAAGANLHAKNKEFQRTALHCLCYFNEEVETLELLIRSGLDVNVKTTYNETALMMAVHSGHIKSAKRLIELGASLDTVRESLRENVLHLAVKSGRHDILPCLLAQKIDYTVPNMENRNIAHMAAIYANTKTLNVLSDLNLEFLDVWAKDIYEKTPLEYIANRAIFSESEEGVHEAFDAFFASVVNSFLHGREGGRRMRD